MFVPKAVRFVFAQHEGLVRMTSAFDMGSAAVNVAVVVVELAVVAAMIVAADEAVGFVAAAAVVEVDRRQERWVVFARWTKGGPTVLVVDLVGGTGIQYREALAVSLTLDYHGQMAYRSAVGYALRSVSALTGQTENVDESTDESLQLYQPGGSVERRRAAGYTDPGHGGNCPGAGIDVPGTGHQGDTAGVAYSDSSFQVVGATVERGSLLVCQLQHR